MLARAREDYQALFGHSWPVWVGGIVYGVVNIYLFLHFQPWSTLDGVLNWGDNLIGRFGIGNAEALSPFLRSGSIINIGVIGGALLGALLAGQFGIRIGPRRELAKGILGGILMGLGAVLVRGCNIGGFFSGTGSLGAHGLVMGIGLIIGAFLGVRYLIWEMNNVDIKPGRPTLWHNAKRQPAIGFIFFLIILGAAFIYSQQGYSERGIILLFGALLGVVSQRSRICFVRAFREPFLTGEASHTKAMLLALSISVVGIALAKYAIFEREYDFVRQTFWQGSLIGGTIFGVGMILSGGCGGGTLWRVGEGHIKLWLALIMYTLSATLFNHWLVVSGLIDRLGEEVFLPDVVGWTWTVPLLLVIFLLWYYVVQWNEESGQLTAL